MAPELARMLRMTAAADENYESDYEYMGSRRLRAPTLPRWAQRHSVFFVSPRLTAMMPFTGSLCVYMSARPRKTRIVTT